MSTVTSLQVNKKDSLDIVPYSRESLGGVLKLLNLSLGEKENLDRNSEYWNWKHERNPFGRSIMLLGYEEKKLVGVRAFLRWQFHWKGQILNAVRPVDSVTHPQARRRGVFSRLTNAACRVAEQDRTDFIFNTPNKNSLPGYLKLGWQEVGTLPVMMKMVKPIKLTWNILKARFRRNHWYGLKENSTFTESLERVTCLFENEREIIELISREAGKGKDESIATVKNISFLKWRYTRHPQREYYVQRYYESGVLLSLIHI